MRISGTAREPDLHDSVDRTLSLWRSTAFEYGQADCMLSVGDYIASQGGQDVTGLFRGCYSTEAEALVRMARYGGACGLVDLTGLARTDTPRRGDVCVVDTIGGIEVGALCTGDGIAVRLERGIIEVKMRLIKIVASWSIGA